MRAAPSSCGGEQTGSPNTNAGRERIQRDRLKVAARRTHEERNEIILAPSARPQNGRDNNGTDRAAAAWLCALGGVQQAPPCAGTGIWCPAVCRHQRPTAMPQHHWDETSTTAGEGGHSFSAGVLQSCSFHVCPVPSPGARCERPHAGSPRTLLAALSWGEVGMEEEQYRSNKPQTNPAAQPTYLKPSTSQTIVNLAET